MTSDVAPEVNDALDIPHVKSVPVMRFSEIIDRMKEGVPIIRRSETCIPGSLETSMCLAILSDDLACLQFVRESESEEDQIAVSTLYLAEVEQVAIANSDKHAVGLLVPGRELILELIFASAEDWHCWFSGLQILCSKNKEESISDDSCGTEMQDNSSSSPTAELVTLVNELQHQNESLKNVLDGYDKATEEMKNQLSQERELRQRAENQNSRMMKLLLVREETITELSDLVQSLLRKQTKVLEDDCHEEYFIGSEKKAKSKEPSPQITNLLRHSGRSTPATSVSDCMEAPLVLQSLEQQLRLLEQRKNYLEKMLNQTVIGQ